MRMAEGQVRPVLADRSVRLREALAHPDPKKAEAAMKTLLGMKKLDLAEIQQAADRA